LRTQLWTTRPLCTQLQSLLLLYDPKTRFTLRLNHFLRLIMLRFPIFCFLLALFIRSHGLRTMGRSFKLTLHYKHKDRQPCDSIMTSRSAPTNRGVFTMDFVKTWALSPKTCLGGGFHAQQGPVYNTYESTHHELQSSTFELVLIKSSFLFCFRLWSKVSAQPISHPLQSHLPSSLHLSIRYDGPLDLILGISCMSFGIRAIILVLHCLLQFTWQLPSPWLGDWSSKAHPIDLQVGLIAELLLHSDLQESSWLCECIDFELWRLFVNKF